MTRRRTPRTVRVQVPEAQAKFIELPGPAGGVFISLLWNWGDALEVTWRDIRELLKAARNGSVVIARRLTAAEQRRLQNARHGAFVVPNDNARWQRTGGR